jgi:ABC-type branched-subunit amino acid transport system substrate-binding protein
LLTPLGRARHARRPPAHRPRRRRKSSIGGFTRDEAEALSEIAQESGALFLNIAAPSDSLQAGLPSRYLPSSRRAPRCIIDALFGWFVRAGHRRWFIVHDDSAEGEERAALRPLAARRAALGRNSIAGEAMLRQDDSRDLAPALAAIAETGPDVVLVLSDWRSQLDFLSRYETTRPRPRR